MPKPKPIQAPRNRTLHLTVRCPIEPSIALRVDDGRNGHSPRVERFPGEDAWKAYIVLDEKTPDFWGAHLTVSAEGYLSASLDFVLPEFIDPSGVDLPEILLRPVIIVPTLAPLSIEGAFFRAGGQPITIIECSDFKLLKRYLDHEDIAPILQQRKALGFNCLRVFGMCKLMWDLNPAFVPDYYGILQRFVDAVNLAGLYVELTVFPDCSLVMPDKHDQLVHWARVCDVLRGRQVLVELQNEASEPPNRIDANDFQKPFGVISSHGSNGSESTPVRPWWDYETFHTNDASEWWRKNSHNGMEFSEGTDGIPASHVPILANENTRFADKDSNLNHAFDAAAAGALLTSGSCYHSVSGKTSDVWSGLELAAADQWVKGARSVDLSQRVFPYEHPAELEGPDDLRVYRRGNCVVRIRR